MSEENLEGLDAPEITETVETPETPAEPASPEPAETPKSHPAHEKLLSELPEAWHAKVTPHLQEFDRNVQQQLEKFSPFKQFVDDGVDPAFLVQSMQLAKAIASDPLTVHQNLTNALMQQGLIREEAEKAAEEIIEENSDPYESDDELSPAMKKELQRRDAELDQIKEQLSSQEFEKATQAELETLNREFGELQNSYDVTKAQETAILELMDAAIARGEDMTVFQAAKKLVQITGVGFKRKGSSDAPAAAAPTVLGGSGGNGVPFENVEIPADSKQKKEMLAQLFKNNLG
jgi:hypothetical protein